MKQPAKQFKIILASGSPRRVEMLQSLGLKFEVLPADVDETVTPGITPPDLVSSLALSKAQRVEEIIKERQKTAEHDILIIAADTVVALGMEILGKPINRDDAIETLKALSGKAHQVFTGVSYLHLDKDLNRVAHIEQTDETEVFFRDLDIDEITSYVDTAEPMDKAGAYALQGIGAFMVSKINGCPANVKGLPTPLVVQQLRQFGILVMGL